MATGSWILHALRQLHLEGSADRIDKGPYPIAELPGIAGYADAYNQHYREAPETLARFNLALEALARGEGEPDAAHEAWSLFHFGAHPSGLFMAATTVDALGPEAILADLGDPFAFLRRFQSVQPVFSDEALAFLNQLESELRGATRADPKP